MEETVNIKKLISTGTGINIENGGMGVITDQNKSNTIIEQKLAVLKDDVPKQLIKDDAIYYITNEEGALKKIIIRGQEIEVQPKGEPGTSSYLYIKYSVNNPESDEEIHSEFVEGDKYIGICVSESSTAPDTYSDYTWVKFVGDPGIMFVSTSGVAGNATSGSYLSTRWYCSGVNDITTPYNGMMVATKIPVAGVSGAGVVFSINGNTDSEYHPILYNSTTALTSHYPVGSVMIFTYDTTVSASRYLTSNKSTSISGCWKSIADYDSTNTYQFRNGNGPYTALTAVTANSLLLQHSPTHLMSISSGGSTSGHVYDTTNEFDPFGMIYHTTTSYGVGKSISAPSLYTQINLTTSYTFNDTITSAKDVYLVAIPQSNGRAKLDANPLSQTLPTTNDGKIYILLGHASSTTSMELHPHHPIYYHDGTSLRLWTNSVNVASEVQQQLASMTETWTFTLSDNSTVTKSIVVVPQSNS